MGGEDAEAEHRSGDGAAAGGLFYLVVLEALQQGAEAGDGEKDPVEARRGAEDDADDGAEEERDDDGEHDLSVLGTLAKKGGLGHSVHRSLSARER
jgi:hypothetical protein